ncbi:acetylcholinesterase-like isoform X2 [Amblyomma americanum]
MVQVRRPALQGQPQCMQGFGKAAKEDSRAPPAAFVPVDGASPKSPAAAGAGAPVPPGAYHIHPAAQPAASHQEGRQFNAREPAGRDDQWDAAGGQISDAWDHPKGTEGNGHLALRRLGMVTDDIYRGESCTWSSDGRGGDALSDESLRHGHRGRDGAETLVCQEPGFASRFSPVTSGDESRAMMDGISRFRDDDILVGLGEEADGRPRSPVPAPRQSLPGGDRNEEEAAKSSGDAMSPRTRRWCTRSSLMVMAFVLALSLALVTVIVAVYEYLWNLDRPVARGQFGAVRGQRIVVSDQGRDWPVFAFLGVPFAKAARGSLRFKPPLPLDRPLGDGKNEGGGALDCWAKRPPCPQQDFYLGRDLVSPVNASEDCLHLNIWAPPWNCTPDTQPGTCEQRTVLFFLYGASFQNGGNSFELYDGRYLSALGNVVVVVPNYRVGALGFLSGPWDNRLQGNAGLHDQRLALEWTLTNIGSFGGNASLVVLAGHDAGASSLGFHLFSGDTDFWTRNTTRFILQSGGPFHRYEGQATEGARLLASSLRCPADLESDRALQCLQTASVDGVARSQLALAFAPVFNRAPLLRPRPREGLERSSHSKAENPRGLEFLLGRVGSEGSYPWFVTQHRTTSSDSRRLATRLLGQKALERWQTATGVTLDSQSADAPYQEAVGDVLEVCPMAELAEQLHAWQNRVYVYMLGYRPSYSEWPDETEAVHFEDMELVFGMPFRPMVSSSDRDKQWARTMIHVWATFARTGRPPTIEGAKWSEYDSSHPTLMKLGPKEVAEHFDRKRQLCDIMRADRLSSPGTPSLPPMGTDRPRSAAAAASATWTSPAGCIAVVTIIYASVLPVP